MKSQVTRSFGEPEDGHPLPRGPLAGGQLQEADTVGCGEGYPAGVVGEDRSLSLGDQVDGAGVQVPDLERVRAFPAVIGVRHPHAVGGEGCGDDASPPVVVVRRQGLLLLGLLISWFLLRGVLRGQWLLPLRLLSQGACASGQQGQQKKGEGGPEEGRTAHGSLLSRPGPGSPRSDSRRGSGGAGWPGDLLPPWGPPGSDVEGCGALPGGRGRCRRPWPPRPP